MANTFLELKASLLKEFGDSIAIAQNKNTIGTLS